ncbi:MAG: PEGA domain-containing protein [Elusimicrobiota bacterium]
MNKIKKIGNKYIIIAETGESSFFRYYKAMDLELWKWVSVKKVKEKYLKNPSAKDLLRKECFNSLKLKNTGILKTLNYAEEKEGFYIINDYTVNISFKHIINKHAGQKKLFPPELSAFIIAETLRALDYAHSLKSGRGGSENGFAHYALSPENILISERAGIKLEGFETKALLNVSEKALKARLPYLSSEQINKKETGCQSDIYSCGLIFYEALTGKKAYGKDRTADSKIDIRILDQKRVPARIKDILKRMLQRDPSKRYSSAQECLKHIEEYLNGPIGMEKWKNSLLEFLNKNFYQELKTPDPEADNEENKKLSLINFKTEIKYHGRTYIVKYVKNSRGKAKNIEVSTQKGNKTKIKDKIEDEFKSLYSKNKIKESFSINSLYKEAELKPQDLNKKDKIAEDKKTSAPAHESDTVKKGERDSKKDNISKEKNEPEEKKEFKSSAQEEEAVVPHMEEKFLDRQMAFEEKEKTVIDFVLDSAKKYKKIVLSLCIFLVGVFITFAAADTYFQMTPLGIKINNIIWPPALSIDTFPSGSRIRILNSRGEDIIQRHGYSRVTPSHIKKISPGTYTLKLSKDNFGEITRVISVMEQKRGEQQINVVGARSEQGVYVIPYEVRIDIDSSPAQAEVFLDGKNVGRTPFSGDIEIGKYSLKLEREGFEPLGTADIPDSMQPGVCVIDTSQVSDYRHMVDDRFWSIDEERLSDRKKKLNINARLYRRIALKSEPKGVEITVTDSETSEVKYSGTTPVEDLMLSVGEYDIELKKEGYESVAKKLDIGVDTEDILQMSMNRYITVNAVEEGTGRKINADIFISSPGMATVRGKTPVRVALPLENAKFSLAREPSYESVNISRDVRRLSSNFNVRMRLKQPHLTVNAVDYETGKGIEGATVWINDIFWKRTDSSGQASGYIKEAADLYEIVIKSDRHGEYKTSLNIDKGHRRNLNVTLGQPQDAILKVETPAGHSLKSISIDGETVKPGAFNVIRNIARGNRRVEIELEGVDSKASKTLNFSSSEEFILLKVKESGGKVSLESMQPPGIKLQLVDYNNREPVPGAKIWLGDRMIGRTNENGFYSSFAVVSPGKYTLRIKKEGFSEIIEAVELENNKIKDLVVKAGVPHNGVIVFDISDEIYDARIYVNGEYRGENVSMLSNIRRGSNLIEVQSDIYDSGTSKIINLGEKNSLAAVRLSVEENDLFLKEIDPAEHLR